MDDRGSGVRAERKERGCKVIKQILGVWLRRQELEHDVELSRLKLKLGQIWGHLKMTSGS